MEKKPFVRKKKEIQKKESGDRKGWIIAGISSYTESLSEKGYTDEFCNSFKKYALKKLNSYLSKSDEEIQKLLEEKVEQLKKEFKTSGINPKGQEIKTRKKLFMRAKNGTNKGIAKLKEVLKERKERKEQLLKERRIENAIREEKRRIEDAIREKENEAKRLINELDDQVVKEQIWILEELLRRFNYYQISALGRIKKIPDMKTISVEGRYGVYDKRMKREFDDYVEDLGRIVSLDEVLTFAMKEGVRDSHEFGQRVEDMKKDYGKQIQKIKKDGSDGIRRIRGEEIEESSEQNQDSNPIFEEIISEINEFEMPASPHIRGELPYQLTLYGWLKKTFKDAEIERQVGSSRPDIVIDSVAIEVKGPTNYKDLETIANKAMRYPINFRNGLIIVLFDVKVYGRYYNEWLTALKEQHPTAIVIRK